MTLEFTSGTYKLRRDLKRTTVDGSEDPSRPGQRWEVRRETPSYPKRFLDLSPNFSWPHCSLENNLRLLLCLLLLYCCHLTAFILVSAARSILLTLINLSQPIRLSTQQPFSPFLFSPLLTLVSFLPRRINERFFSLMEDFYA